MSDPETGGYVPPEYQNQGSDWHYKAETKEGERQFAAEKVTDPEDPRLRDVQKLLSKTFGREKVDSLEVTQGGMRDKDDPYNVVLIKEAETGKLAGAILSGNIRVWGENGEPPPTDRVIFETYTVVPEAMRGQGHGKSLEGYNLYKEVGAAEMKGQNLRGLVTESEPSAIDFHDRMGKNRMYFQDEKGNWQEVPYACIPLDWDVETGEPAKDAAATRENLMYMSNDSKNRTLTAQQATDLVRSISYYNSWYEKDFKNPDAYERHQEIVDEHIQRFADAVGEREIRLMSQAERVQLEQQGATFVDNFEKPKEEAPVAAK